MGQKLSGLIESRKARKGVQCPSAVDGRLQRVMSQEGGTAASPSNGVETATLLVLPTELILAVACYLPLSGYMSLSYSCRTIRNRMGAYFAHVLGDKVPLSQQPGSTLSIETRNIRFLERLDLRSMLDRDREMSSSEESLARLVWREWRCSINAGLLWICPDRQCDYNEATKSTEMLEMDRCLRSPLFAHGRFGDTFFVRLRIMRVSRDLEPSCEEVKEALRPLDAHVCPHLRLNDACVASVYHRDCLKTRLDPGAIDPAQDCGCGPPPSFEQPWPEICNFCGTIILFDIIMEYGGPYTLAVTIVRGMRGMRENTQRAWIAQVAQPADFEEYERAWQATYAQCFERLGSDGPVSRI